ncbi:MAG TPA: peptide chain release factor N(5)-glutamine methyltransferase [bacterium]|nr:peptide chain release factor N(5)-glutamine methyltransferase [bacterium]
MTLTISNLIHKYSKELENISDSPRLDVEIMLSRVLNLSRFDLLMKANDSIDSVDEKRFAELFERRMNFEPVAYIINEKPFFEDVFYVDSRVLIPRPETEFLVMEALDHLKSYEKRPNVLDICCGSGCAGLSVLRVIDCDLTMSDISKDALDVTAVNVEKLFPGRENVKLVQSDMFENIREKQDVIIANPPYLSTSDMTGFVKGELIYEPVSAFFGGEDGFEFTEKLLNAAGGYLNTGGMIAVELGFEGSKFIKDVYGKIELQKIKKDYNGIDRVAIFNLCRQ